MRGAPPLDVLYRPNQRRIPRVRLFIDFVGELFREMEAERGEKAGGTFSYATAALVGAPWACLCCD